ncbi:MAG: MBL fold metallo-hydrolase [Bacillota bacterium]|nr:MBL fold metallo-hydrolase [Bacillota bacterium]
MKRKLKSMLASLCCTVLLVSGLTACSKPDTSTAQNAATGETTDSKGDKDMNKNDINKNDTGKTVIKAISTSSTYPNNSYMIISKSGTVLVADPYMVTSGIKPDIITSTHSHPDHNDQAFYDKNKGVKTSLYKVESFSFKDIKVSSIASTHGDTINKDNPSNVIYVYEVDGLRIAHMGDIAQDQLTDEQVKALGKIDIAFMQFVNSYSDYSLENGKGFKLIEQLKPQIIIPTHSSPEATKKIGDIVGKYEKVENVLSISKDDLKDGTRKVIEIKNTLK